MDMYCRDLRESLEALQARAPERMFCNWKECWEQPARSFGPNGNVMLQEKLRRKYVGFKLVYDSGFAKKTYIVHEVQFIQDSRPRKFMLVGVTPEFDTNLSPNDNDGHTYDLWDFCEETYLCFSAYYSEFAKDDRVDIYHKDGICDSEEEEEADDA